MTTPTVHGAAVRVKVPPALYVVPFLLTLAVHYWLVAFPIGGRPATTVLGVVLVLGGFGFSAAGTVAILRHGTTVVPHHAVSALVTSGPYRISRNPMYAGLSVGYVGAAFWVGSWWPLLALPLILPAVQMWVILPEERYLAERFGAAFMTYRESVRRWF